MIKIFLLTAATLAALTCGAQDTVVLRHANGKPALTGPCTFFVNPYIPTDLHHAILRERHEAGMVRHRPFGDYYDMGADRVEVRDADRGMSMGLGRRSLEITYGLGFSCDGVVTTFYSNGSKEAEILFSRGVPTGPYTEYYPEGGVAIRCTLDRGMPAGEWLRYYKNGAVYARGTFNAAPERLLQEEWQSFSSRKERDAFLNRTNPENSRPFEESGLRDTEREQARALSGVFREFDNLLDKLPLHATPVGEFVFTHRDGTLLADLRFDSAGHRTGLWTIWKAPGKVRARLEYSRDGELTHVTDTTTKRTTPAGYTARWRIREAAEEERRRRMPTVSIVEAAPPTVSSTPQPSVFTFAEQMPEFPGDIRAYLSTTLRYPAEAKQNGIEGRVVLRFVVRPDGSITDASVLRGIGGGCDEEALRVVRAMPKWKPGKQNGKPVAVWFNLPITFRIN